MDKLNEIISKAKAARNREAIARIRAIGEELSHIGVHAKVNGVELADEEHGAIMCGAMTALAAVIEVLEGNEDGRSDRSVARSIAISGASFYITTCVLNNDDKDEGKNEEAE